MFVLHAEMFRHAVDAIRQHTIYATPCHFRDAEPHFHAPAYASAAIFILPPYAYAIRHTCLPRRRRAPAILLMMLIRCYFAAASAYGAAFASAAIAAADSITPAPRVHS